MNVSSVRNVILAYVLFAVMVYSWSVTNGEKFDCRKCEHKANEVQNYTCPVQHKCLGRCYGPNCQKSCPVSCMNTCDDAGKCTLIKMFIQKIGDQRYTNICLGIPKQCFNVTINTDGAYGLVIRDMNDKTQNITAPEGINYYNQTLSKTHSYSQHKLTLESDNFNYSGKDFADILNINDRQIKGFHFLLANQIKATHKIHGLESIDHIGFLGIGKNQETFYQDLLEYFIEKHMISEKILVYYQRNYNSEVAFLGDIPSFYKNGDHLDLVPLVFSSPDSIDFKFNMITTANTTDIFKAPIKVNIITHNYTKNNFVLILEEKFEHYFKKYYLASAIACKHCEFVNEKLEDPKYYDVYGYFRCNNINIYRFPQLGFSISGGTFVYMNPIELFEKINDKYIFKVGFVKGIKGGELTLGDLFLRSYSLYMNYEENTFGILGGEINPHYKHNIKEYNATLDKKFKIGECINDKFKELNTVKEPLSKIIDEEQLNYIPDEVTQEDEELTEITYEIDYIILTVAVIATMLLGYMLFKYFKNMKTNYIRIDNNDQSTISETKI